jgi:hypothetical protein
LKRLRDGTRNDAGDAEALAANEAIAITRRWGHLNPRELASARKREDRVQRDAQGVARAMADTHKLLAPKSRRGVPAIHHIGARSAGLMFEGELRALSWRA